MKFMFVFGDDERGSMRGARVEVVSVTFVHRFSARWNNRGTSAFRGPEKKGVEVDKRWTGWNILCAAVQRIVAFQSWQVKNTGARLPN